MGNHPRPQVGVIGAGRVGAVLAARLKSAGYPIAAVSGQSDASRTRIETMLPDVPVTDASYVADVGDLLILAVPDDALVGLTEQLARDHHLRPGQVVAHTSGRHGTRALDAAAELGARVIAMHPAMTFTGTDVDLERLTGCVFGLTVGDADREAAESVVMDLGGRAVRVPEEQRITYHAALAHGANHLVTLVSQAMALLRQSGADDPSAVLRPLLGAALDNVLDYGDAALTGPVVRGDVSTVQAHVDALADAPAATLDSYLQLADATAGTAVADGRLSADRAREIRRALTEADWNTLAAIHADAGS